MQSPSDSKCPSQWLCSMLFSVAMSHAILRGICQCDNVSKGSLTMLTTLYICAFIIATSTISCPSFFFVVIIGTIFSPLTPGPPSHACRALQHRPGQGVFSTEHRSWACHEPCSRKGMSSRCVLLEYWPFALSWLPSNLISGFFTLIVVD